ncbi:MAG: type I methionyl aminopeptidase [Dehalococcoidia bacterium]|nr:type I methionyl aminopeptidase [Dehalococcoidia bacterium]MQG16423.1 type I methionyl aminopeptidase [SAR202 cluster bacterium]|tara:strand:+ start:6200 stop:6964 length:765 start_codon:yes stop_codon:yes gene_type:complete
MGITIKSSSEFDLMREAGRIVGLAKLEVANAIKPGVTTSALDQIAERVIRSEGAIPSFKGYGDPHNPFPASICASINDEIVHGIPGNRVLDDGDIISVDCGAIWNGLHADSAFTSGVGNISKEAAELIKVTSLSLEKGIEKAVIGNRIGDVCSAIQTYAEAQGYSLVRHYVGHGIGYSMHEDPQVPNWGMEPGLGPLLKEGMAIAIEPMLNIGNHRTKVLSDGWTVSTDDGELSAHFEHTVLITNEGPEVTTRC